MRLFYLFFFLLCFFAELVVAELHKKIKEAFEVFDHELNNTVDVRFGNFYLVKIQNY